jgi:uncharacterized membrane protein
MGIKGFSVGEVIKFGWQTFKKHVGLFIILLLISFALQLIPYFFAEYFYHRGAAENQNSFFIYGVVLNIISFILSLLMAMGFVKVGLRFTNNENAKISDLFTTFPKIIKYFVSSILYSLLMIAGFILLVFPAFIWGARYSLFPYFIIDQGAGPIQALKQSAKATMGAKWDIFSLWMVEFVLTMAGVACIILGLFVALPVVLVANALVYRKLVAQTAQQKGVVS